MCLTFFTEFFYQIEWPPSCIGIHTTILSRLRKKSRKSYCDYELDSTGFEHLSKYFWFELAKPGLSTHRVRVYGVAANAHFSHTENDEHMWGWFTIAGSFGSVLQSILPGQKRPNDTNMAEFIDFDLFEFFRWCGRMLRTLRFPLAHVVWCEPESNCCMYAPMIKFAWVIAE